jgi:ATP-dependent DNA helicase RecQ
MPEKPEMLGAQSLETPIAAPDEQTTPPLTGPAGTGSPSDGSTDLRSRIQHTAAAVFGWDELHPEQLRAVEQVLAGRDVLAVLPTGAGKSAIYQVATVLLDGPTVVVSPLLALQRDQIEGLARTNAPAAVAVNSAQRSAEREDSWAAVRDGSARFLFLSPEQLARDDVIDQLSTLGVRLFVVDEAHCVSAWGHDFRPDYLRMGQVVERLGHPRVIALTASAAPPVRDEIVSRLGLRDPAAVIAGFDRPELQLGVEHVVDAERKRAGVVARVRALAEVRPDGRGLVYTASRKDAEYYAEELTTHGLPAAAYHAGMKADRRERVHEDFLSRRVRVVVATSAFGMGIDVPDVRFVVHASVPESPDTYYQQIGRAGRDGEPAEVILFHRPEDLHLQTFLTASRVPEKALRDVARALRKSDTPLTGRELAERIDATPARRTRAVNLLEQVGAVGTADGELVWLDARLTPKAALERAQSVADTHQQLIRSRVEMMRGYAETTGCRRQFLLGYFGEQLAEPCGNCDTCAAGTAERRSTVGSSLPVNSAVRHRSWGRGIVMSVEADRLTVLFDEVGYRTLATEAVREAGLLVPEGDDPASGSVQAA